MRICNLASGSGGNSTFIQTDNYKILIDLGKNKKYIVEKLNSIGVDYTQIDYVFLTHTHDDHTSALKTFLKKHSATLVITKKMFMELKNTDNLENIMLYDDTIDIPGLNIQTFKMSHDVQDARSFLIEEKGASFLLITDTGYINTRYLPKMRGKTLYFIESNHDIEMLTHGPYPEWLKKRVLSDEGHLSNKFAGTYLSKMITKDTRDILLLHLSEQNNSEKKALDTVTDALHMIGENNIKIKCAKPSDISEVYEI